MDWKGAECMTWCRVRLILCVLMPCMLMPCFAVPIVLMSGRPHWSFKFGRHIFGRSTLLVFKFMIRKTKSRGWKSIFRPVTSQRILLPIFLPRKKNTKYRNVSYKKTPLFWSFLEIFLKLDGYKFTLIYSTYGEGSERIMKHQSDLQTPFWFQIVRALIMEIQYDLILHSVVAQGAPLVI